MAMHVQKCCRTCLRLVHRGSVRSVGPCRRWLTEAVAASDAGSEAIDPPSMAGQSKIYPEKIQKIVADISTLTLLETSQLNEMLKTTLNIPDAPVMTAMAAPAAQIEDEEPKEVKTAFTVKLVKLVPESKIKLIKEVKGLMEGMNLVQAKKFVESLPQEVRCNVKKEEADKIADALKAAGGTVEIE